MADYEITLFSMVRHSKYEYLFLDLFMYSFWNNKKKINRIIKNLKFCESFDAYMNNIE